MALHVSTDADLEREAFLRLPVGVAILRLDDPNDLKSFRVVDCNDASATVAGRTRESSIGRLLYDYSPQTFESGRAAQYAEVIHTGKPRVIPNIDPATSVVLAGSYLVHAFPMPDRCVGLMYLDATDLRAAEQRERLSSRQLERAHEIARIGSWCYTLPDGPMGWSEEMARICGREVDAGGLEDGLDFAWMHPDDRPLMRKDIEQLRRDRRPRRRDIRVIRPDGTLRLLDSSVELGVDHSGRAIELVGVVRDVTVERVALDAVARSERRLREAERVGQIGSWEWDMVAQRNVWSDELYRIYGLAPQAVELSYEDVVSREHPEDRARLGDVIARAMKDLQPFVVEHRIIRADGAVRSLRTRGKVVTDASGAPIRLVGVAQDVTETRAALAAQERLAAIVESSDDAIVGKALDGTIETWNRGAERLYGYTADEMIGRHGDVLNVAGNVAEVPALIAGIARGEQVDHLATVRRRKDGSLVTLSLTMSPIHDASGAVVGVATIARDITDRHKAEEAARQASERVRLASRATRDLIWDWDMSNDAVWWGDATQRMLGYDPADLPPGAKGWMALIHPEDLDRVISEQRALIGSGGEFWSDEYRLQRADGSYAHVHDRAFVVRDSAGTPIRMVGSLMDVTESRQAEERIRRSERLLGRAQELARLGSFHRDVKAGSLSWSKETYRIYGVDPDTFVPSVESVLALIHPDDRNTWLAAARRAQTEGTPFHIFFRITRPDGETRIIASEGEVSLDADGQPAEVYGFIEDLTGRRRAEEELVRSRAQLRDLAARIEATREEERTQISRRIHEELGQALTALKIDLTALATRLPPQARALRRRARDMAQTLDRTLATTQTIAVELRPGILDVVGLQAAIRWAVDDFTRRTGIPCRATVSRAAIALDDTATTAVFRILQEALTNVVRHASATDINVVLGVADGTLTLTVGDNGVGITPGAVWGPRSLGLLGIRERARGIGGDVTIDGAPGRGTRLTLRLPINARTTEGAPL